MHNYAIEDLTSKENVTIIKDAISKQIEGKEKVEKLIYEHNGELESLNVNAVFVAIGRKPETEILKDKIEVNENGYIRTDDKMQTSIEGIFACGDVRENSIKQIAIAVGEGAIAGTAANKYVLMKK